MNISITSTFLHFREGNSDKEYHVAVEPEGEGSIVTYAYGRRGATLTTGRKTQHIVTLAEANKIHDQLVRQKTAKGYRPTGESRQPDRTSTADGQDSGIRCQLLNPIDESELDRLHGSDAICLQEKFDGLLISLPEPIRHALEELPVDVLIDGEAIGDALHAFDLLEVKGHDIRGNAYLSRFAGLLTLLDPEHKHLRPVNTHMDPEEKRAMFETFRRCGSEGVVFKEIDAPFSAGRPNSGGSQLKYKFVESASFIVTGHNAKRSVTLCLFAEDGGGIIPAGKVTIPPNHRIPAVGQVCETRFLYAFRESGSIYQPVYLGEREDIPAEDCTTAQLKYKAEPAAAAA